MESDKNEKPEDQIVPDTPPGMSDDEIIVRACEALDVKLQNFSFPDLPKRVFESPESRLQLAVLVSQNKVIFDALKTLLQELKNNPENATHPDKVELLIRMLRSSTRGIVEKAEKVLPKEKVSKDEEKRRAIQHVPSRVPLAIHLNTITGIATFVLILVVLALSGIVIRRAEKKAEYWEKEVAEIRTRVAPILDVFTNVPKQPTPVAQPDSVLKEVPKSKIQLNSFYSKIESSFQLPPATQLLGIYMQHFDSVTNSFHEENLRKDVVKSLLDIPQNRVVFLEALQEALEKRLTWSDIDPVLKVFSEKIVLPSGADLLALYAQNCPEDEKRKKLLSLIFSMPENRAVMNTAMESMKRD